MKKLKPLLLIALSTMFLNFYGCSKDEKAQSGCNLEAELNAYQKKITALQNNPSRANCNILKQASLDLIKKAEGCTGVTKDDVLQVTAAWKAVDCSVLD